ncbi:MAG: DUF1073 domain-containing protein [Acidobacteriota bacterium]
MPKVSVRGVARSVRAENRRVADSARRAAVRESKRTGDSFQNFALGLGIGTNNPTTYNQYGYNPMTRQRVELEWAHRGSFIAGLGVDIIADDMTREGVDIAGQFTPDQIRQIDERATTLKIWNHLCSSIKWARLYGGCIAVLLVDKQDYSTPLRVDTVGPGQFKGLLVLDRWMISPSLEDLVTDIGPDLGKPKYYTVDIAAPALRGIKVHYSRCLRLQGDELPYWQAVAENLWGASVLDRPWDRITYFDAATVGAAQQVHKSYLRYFKIDKYRDILGGMGGPQAYSGLMQMVAFMRQFASNEGITMIDAKDDMVTAQASTFTGIADVLLQLGQHLSGNFQIPLVRLFGQSPAGLSSTGESDLKTYYDGVRKRQIQDLLVSVTLIYRLIAQSLRIPVPEGFGVSFRPLWQMDEPQKAEVASKDTATVMEVHGAGIISDQTLLRELQGIQRRTGRWQSISEETVNAASDELPAPEPEGDQSADAPEPPPADNPAKDEAESADGEAMPPKKAA